MNVRQQRTVSESAVAVVGIGCRFPGGVRDSESLWNLLARGRSVVGEVPSDRWNADRYFHSNPAASGRMNVRHGCFVDQLKRFDAAFWGISPREAMRMDPQQRWLLETAWEAMEDGGIPPSQLRGSKTGVFVGAASHDYGTLQSDDLVNLDVHSNTGGTLSIAANRISYIFDLKGPSVAVDTACSSALVAISMAYRAIASGECESALAGGVNALITPNTSIGFSKATMLSPTGECFAFDERANGYVRGEGAGLVLLKPLGQAIKDGDSIYAVIRNALVNQDGHTSSMTVPSIEGQSEMLRSVYDQAGISPHHVVYVEAHGTGTQVGDPIEATALGTVLSQDRPNGNACLIGSIKTNIGHLESASGVAGLIKAALVLDRDTVPPNTNFQTPNPEIPFADLKLQVADRLQPLPRIGETTPVVGVNSFGFGGTNAHVVLEAAPHRSRRQRKSENAERPYVLPISARDDSSLRECVRHYRQALAGIGDCLADFCYSAGARKEQHNHRLVAIGSDARQLQRRLDQWLRGEASEGIRVGESIDAAGSHAFVFTGQGSQWAGMGQQLFDREPIARQTFEEIDQHFQQLSGWSLVEEMSRAKDQSIIDRTTVCQPAIFALQVALVRLWKSWGIEPSAVIGHSVGEVAAAWCAGILSLPDAVRLVFHRSRLQHTTGGHGRMFAAGITPEEARTAIGELSDRVQVTAINSPSLVTLGGDTKPLERVAESLEQQGRFVRWLKLDYAFHTHQMDLIQEELLDALSDLQPRRASIPFVSTVTEQVQAADEMTAQYWWQNVRHPVMFEPALSLLISQGERSFLEIGPHPAMQSSIDATLAARGVKAKVFHSLVREQDESQELATNLADLHISGAEIDWQNVNQSAGNFIRQPAYAWNYKEFWLDQGSMAPRVDPPLHPLLDQRLPAAKPTWQFTLDRQRFPYLNDHQIWDGILFPASGYAEIGLAVADTLFPGERYVVEDVRLNNAMFTSDDAVPTVQVVFEPENKSFSVHSSTDQKHWELNGGGRLVADPSEPNPCAVDLQDIQHNLPTRVDHETLYGELRALGYGFGPDFSLLSQLWTAPRQAVGENSQQPATNQREALAEIAVPEHLAESSAAYRFHPAILDACFQATHGTQNVGSQAEVPDYFFLPETIRRVQLYQDHLPARLYAHATQISDDGTAVVCDIRVYDDQGTPVADVAGFQVAKVAHQRSDDDIGNCLYQFKWEPRRLKGTGIEGSCGFPSTADIEAASQREAPNIYAGHDLQQYQEEFLPPIERLVFQSIQNACLDLGWSYQVGDRFSSEEFLRAHEITDDQTQLAVAQLGWLAADGILSEDDGTWRAMRSLERNEITEPLAELGVKFPRYMSDVALVQATAPNLAAVLSGQVDPLELLFPGGSNELLEDFYNEGLDFPAYRQLFHSTVSQAVASLPRRRAVRVLEIGAGTGSLTRTMLDVLPSDHAEYLFTDIGPAFVASAKNEFADFPFVDYQILDIERDPVEQDVTGGGYDLVVATNVLHATADLRETLANIRSVLAPGGMLLFLEVVRRRPVTDNTFGMLKGWWRFADRDLRNSTPLLACDQWESLLSDCGFDDVGTLSVWPDEDQREQAVFVAREPAIEPVTDAPSIEPSRASDDEQQLQPAVVVFADESGVAEELAERFEKQGDDAILLTRGEAFDHFQSNRFTLVDGSADELRRVFSSAQLAQRGVSSIIHCWSLDSQSSQIDETSLIDAQSRGVLSAMQLAHALAAAELAEPPRVYLVTRGVQSVTGQDSNDGIASSPLVGFCRVANNELSQFTWTLIDLDSEPSPLERDDLFSEITIVNDEREIALRGDRRHVNRLQRVRREELADRRRNALQPDGTVAPYRLQMRQVGVLEELSLNETQRREPGPDEIEVRVMAGGINFRDVMKALGMYPGNPKDLLWFGDDFSGVVQRVGGGVQDLRPGDRVAGIAPYSFRSHVTVDRRMTFKPPSRMSFEESATLPTVFLTTQFAIHQVARMQPGEKILIHAAAGGVGQAAIQVAQHLGLEIFATAGTVEKREFLRSLGVPHIMNSRTYEFADQIMEITGGEGVDMVLNSLAGEFIPKSLSVLAPFARFIEIGKTDVYRNAKLELGVFKNNISYHMIDLAQVIDERPAQIMATYGELTPRFESGDYRPLTHKVFPITEVVNAFRFMAQGHHIGKNVLSFDVGAAAASDDTQENCTEIPIGPCTQQGHLLRSDATYLITGGAGGFGLEIAKWMAAQGARHLVLFSRSGPREDAAVEIETLRADGVTIVDFRGDVTNADDVQRVVNQIGKTDAPLKGVVHAAMVLDDDFITELDADRFNRVLHPKMIGAWNLHEKTKDISLDHFICFSSYSVIIGAPKQASYNAGNCFLDALAQHRRARGLPALTLNWGAVLGAGFVERNEKTAEYLDSMGLKAFGMEEAISVFAEMILRDTPLIGAGRVDWKPLRKLLHGIASSPTFSTVAREQASGRMSGSLQSQLTAAASDQRPRIVEHFLAQQVAGVFGIDASDVDTTIPITNLGLDSLMAVELINRIESATAATIPMSGILNGPSVRELSKTVLELIDLGDEETDHSIATESAVEIGVQADFVADAQLDPLIVPTGAPTRVTTDSRIFLTGATGFLGAQLLAELLDNTNSRFVCLVRAEDESNGRRRIRENMEAYGLEPDGLEDRVEVVAGDFSQPLLGLSEQRFNRLATEIDVIYHNGADVNLLSPYPVLRSANVLGTQEILRLACHKKTKPLHFVSTFTVLATEASRGRRVTESDPLPPCEELLYGYSQTKWVSEKLVEVAQSRGLPVTVYRPGHITGDSLTGAANINDLLHTIILACLRLGAAPLRNVQLDLTPVDYVAKAIAHLSQQPESIGKVFHLTNPQPLTTQAVLEWMKDSGKQVDLMRYEQWRDRLTDLADETHATVDQFRLLTDVLIPRVSGENDRGVHPSFDCTDALNGLADTGISCPPANEKLLAIGHEYLQRTGVVPQQAN